MMRINFDELIQLTDGDGASVAGRLLCDHAEPDAEGQAMLAAWSIERHQAIEAGLVLREVLDFLRRKVQANRMLADSDRSEAQELIHLIQFRLSQES